MSSKEFDPLAYIENAFLDTKKEKTPKNGVPNLDVEVPTIGEFLGKGEKPAKTDKAVTVQPKVKFKRKQLSAPRPRRSKVQKPGTPINDAIKDVWGSLPKNIEFLSSFFDDKVTANYYRGEFKESREDLIRRLLDPELNLEEVSRLLGVCPATVRRYTNRQWLGHHRTKGGQRRFRLSGVVKFVEEHGRHPQE